MYLALWFTAAIKELINLKGLSKVIEKTITSSYKPITKVNKYINYYTNNRKISIDYKFTSYKPANSSTNKKKN